MLTEKSMQQTLGKLQRFTRTLRNRLFIPVASIEAKGLYETRTPLHQIPDRSLFGPVSKTWGGEGVYGWFVMEYTVPVELDGKPLFLYPHTGFYEATLWVNGCIHSNYAAKYIEGSHGNHWCNRFTPAAQAGESYQFALECYAFHDMPGTQPLTCERQESYVYPCAPADICLRDDEVMDVLFDLETLLSLCKSLPEGSFRRAEIENALYEAHKVLMYDPDHCTNDEFYTGLRAASPLFKAQLAKKNGETAPYVGLIGHSHMDTAWLWPLTETEKKCARTYANVMNLMDEYPEFKFVQSSAFHSNWIREDYPELFERIRAAVAEGRYEPNGGVWVECDCNLTGGEYMIRQFLWGQRFTRKYFGYTSDAFWLPDTFGYSYAIPQIMKGCGVNYFLTTKMTWNDTNTFPLTTFNWQGIDGTKVLTHLNRMHTGPSPENYADITTGSDMKEKRVSNMRLFSFGKGDGGGGPEFEMLESARRLADLEGTARSSYTTVSDFMKTLEKTSVGLSTYAGELYLELHRGTLTNQHTIKHNNRFCEIALHNLELSIVQKAVKEGQPADETPVAPLMNTLLVHQFHDILPGTCIHAAHEETYKAVGDAITLADALTSEVRRGDADTLTVYNSTSFDSQGTIYLNGAYEGVEGAKTQAFTDRDGRLVTAVSGLTVPALGSLTLKTNSSVAEPSPFTVDGRHIVTPFADITLDENGFMASFIDRRTGRELVGGLPFNTLLMAEDVSSAWDNWDIDADIEEKLRPAGKLTACRVVSDGPVELRLSLCWQLTEKSSVQQDIIFDAHSPLVTFDTVMNWQEAHRLMKVAFDTSLVCDGVRNEIQFGHIRRSNHRSTSVEKARFEICNHKFSDLSETNYGVTLLNDSKYGLSVNEGSMRLSLHKGGILPDDQGDMGVHRCRYAILPHVGGFSEENVIRPAYAFNYPPVVQEGGRPFESLCRLDGEGVIVETVKPCEDAQRAYILRLYEATGGYSKVRIRFSHPVKALYDCNMLEEELERLDPSGEIVFTPFKIRTLKVEY
ncbi:MAG: alpha-mannosidase [Clostridia bacterium]|nr:alpha-mannosidase [Clostridia bacterium]